MNHVKHNVINLYQLISHQIIKLNFNNLLLFPLSTLKLIISNQINFMTKLSVILTFL